MGSLEVQMNQLEPFLTVIVEANEQARMKIKAQAMEVADLSAQLTTAKTTIDKLTLELSAHASKSITSAVDCLITPQETNDNAHALLVEADSADASIQLPSIAPEGVVSICDEDNSVHELHSSSSPVAVEEFEDDGSFADEDDLAPEQDDIEDLEAFQQYVLLEDADTKAWTVSNKDSNASAFTIVSNAITSDMVGCGPDGLFMLSTKTAERSPQLLARLEENEGLLLVGASEDDIARLPLDWFTTIDLSKLSVLERRAIFIALLTPALMYWLHEFSAHPESAHKYMWFRLHLDSLMELTEEDPTAKQQQVPSSWSDVEYLAATATSPEACATKDNESDASTASDEE